MCLVRYGKIDYFKPVRSNCTTTKRLKELKIAIEVFHMVFGAIYQDHFFKLKIFIIHSTLATMRMIPF